MPPPVGFAAAQAPPPSPKRSFTPPPFPSAFDFGAVPLGAWAEYEETIHKTVMSLRRISVVARDSQGTTIERMYSGRVGFGQDRVACSEVYARRESGGRRIGTVLFQVNANAPNPQFSNQTRANSSESNRSRFAPARSLRNTIDTRPLATRRSTTGSTSPSFHSG